VLLLQGQVAGGQLLVLQLQGGVTDTQRLEVLVGSRNLRKHEMRYTHAGVDIS
jgi:hypothetical protein